MGRSLNKEESGKESMEKGGKYSPKRFQLIIGLTSFGDIFTCISAS